MVDPARTRFRRADERKPRRQLKPWEPLLHVLFNTDSVLDEDHKRIISYHWREQAFQQMVVDGFQTHEHHVALRHVVHVAIDCGAVEME